MILWDECHIRFLQHGQYYYMTLKAKQAKDWGKALNFYKNKKGYLFLSSTCYHDQNDTWI
jgi:hypothetical protein